MRRTSVGGKQEKPNAYNYLWRWVIEGALSRGVKEIILGLGGSATNDFGCGAAAALGVNFYNANDELVRAKITE